MQQTSITDQTQEREAGGFGFTLVESSLSSCDGDLKNQSHAMQSRPAQINTRKLHLACDEAEHMHAWVVRR